jgi:aspartate/methionine/tyrosine aminotransferase
VFSGRLPPDARNRLALLLDEKRRAGVSLIDLTIANPTQVGFVYPPELLAPLADPRGLVYAPDPRGLREARAALGDPDDVVLCASTSEAYGWLFKLLCDPGDAVLAPRPSYPLLEHLAALDAVELASYRLAYDGAWHLDVPSLVEALTPRTRAILVVSPGNPTGSYASDDELARLVEIARAHELALVLDEVFAERPQRLPDGALTFRLGGLSKSAGLPGLKLAWIVASGPRKTEALERLEIIADSYLSVATPVQLALPRLLEARAAIQPQITGRARANRARIAERVAGTSLTLLHADAGWSAVLRAPATRTDEELALALLGEHDVLVHPGYFFDLDAGTFVVVSLLVPPADLDRGLDALLALK